jgi:non-ribosomal peptide synthetase component F
LGRAPLAQVMLVLQNAPREELQLKEIDLELFSSWDQQSKFDFSLFLANPGGRIIATFYYDCDLFDPSTVARIADNYRTLLGHAVVNPDQKISLITVQSQEQTEELRTAFSDAITE